MTPVFFGLMRIKNESRWIARVIEAQLPLVDRLLILDDHSTDDTVEICERYDKVTLFRSPFEGLDESRDKNWLLQRAYESIPCNDQHFALGNADSPYWCLALDGDEELLPDAPELLREAATSDRADSYAVRILYAWDRADQVRVDGVYGAFTRPSLFRLMNKAFTYKRTPWGGNLHCSSIPQEMIGGSRACRAALLHFGYIDAELRRRKYEFYTRVDPDNPAEDWYRHLTQGDPGGWPAKERLKHAGPLCLEPLSTFISPGGRQQESLTAVK